jgi:hypothetical protein
MFVPDRCAVHHTPVARLVLKQCTITHLNSTHIVPLLLKKKCTLIDTPRQHHSSVAAVYQERSQLQQRIRFSRINTFTTHRAPDPTSTTTPASGPVVGLALSRVVVQGQGC